MIPDKILKEQLKFNLEKTNFNLGKKYEGKVRDNYLLGDKRIIITTDRISAFDRVLCTLPFKGQVLNQTAAFWFEKTKGIVANHESVSRTRGADKLMTETFEYDEIGYWSEVKL